LATVFATRWIPSNESVPEPVISVNELTVEFKTEDGVVHAVSEVSWELYPGEVLGIVGESGSGKSVSTMTLLGLIPMPPGRIASGGATFEGEDLFAMSKKRLTELRGGQMAMIFQDPMTSLNPVFTIGDQIIEALLAHHPGMKDDAARERTIHLLETVGVPYPERRVDQYPHEFSGGMRQRAMIAMALSCDPSLLIADEPTTALDVTVQAQILDLIDRLQSEFNTAVALITHDLGVVAEHCDHIQVMYAGKIVEEGTADDIYYRPMMPYTWGLLRSLPRLGHDTDRLTPIAGAPPSLIFLPDGCSFSPRCPYVFDECRVIEPDLLPIDGHHAARCHLSLEDRERIVAQEILATP